MYYTDYACYIICTFDFFVDAKYLLVLVTVIVPMACNSLMCDVYCDVDIEYASAV